MRFERFTGIQPIEVEHAGERVQPAMSMSQCMPDNPFEDAPS